MNRVFLLAFRYIIYLHCSKEKIAKQIMYARLLVSIASITSINQISISRSENTIMFRNVLYKAAFQATKRFL